MDPAAQLPLAPHVLHILISVHDRGRHGYAIVKDIEQRTKGKTRLGTSTLYAALKRMVRHGMLEETRPPPDELSDDARRRYYRATDYGRAVARAEAQRIRELDAMLRGARWWEDAGEGGR